MMYLVHLLHPPVNFLAGSYNAGSLLQTKKVAIYVRMLSLQSNH
jgi:hypothetical protein